jgi:DNA repair exonuclease SbcCD ATPase subunit
VDGVEPSRDEELERLEQANADLRRVNARLARGLIGTSSSAAAALQARLERAEHDLAVARAELAERERAEREQRELQTWIDHLQREIASRERELEGIRASQAWRLASRYWDLRDRLLRRARR